MDSSQTQVITEPAVKHDKAADLKAAVIGAGYMGSAITFPLSENNIQVNLWGTWLDDKIISSSLDGFHPKLKKALPPSVTPFYYKDLKEALKGIDMLFMAVVSEGFVKVFEMVLENLSKPLYFFKLTKGIVRYNGTVMRATEAALDMLAGKFGPKDFAWATIGGPVKAMELSDKIPTASIYALNNTSLAQLAYGFSTDYYPITLTDDIPGVEISSAFKNVYSIVIGICDGLFKPTKGNMYHNFNSFLFNQATIEMAQIAEKAGGRKETVFDLAGIGDFYVASLSGRNRRYGEYVGMGEDPQKIFKKMFDEGEVAEGYFALNNGVEWVKSLGMNLMEELPLLHTLHSIIFKGKQPMGALQDFTDEMRARFKKAGFTL